MKLFRNNIQLLWRFNVSFFKINIFFQQTSAYILIDLSVIIVLFLQQGEHVKLPVGKV